MARLCACAYRPAAVSPLPGEGTATRVWRCDTWEIIADLPKARVSTAVSGVAFHPHLPILATLGEEDTVIRIWDLDIDLLLGAPAPPTVHYTNAKVVLVGESSTGKTCLARALAGEPFKPQESTHGRRVWTFDSRRKVDLGENRKEMRETLLWDLAGQPGYRMIHQLHLNEVAVALVVFDARSETDPFAGRPPLGPRPAAGPASAGRRQLHLSGSSLSPPGTDREGIAASEQRIQAMVRELGFDGYIATSAKEGWGIADLADAYRQSHRLGIPAQRSARLSCFRASSSSCWKRKEAGRLLSTAEDLYRAFLATHRQGTLPADIRATVRDVHRTRWRAGSIERAEFRETRSAAARAAGRIRFVNRQRGKGRT